MARLHNTSFSVPINWDDDDWIEKERQILDDYANKLKTTTGSEFIGEYLKFPAADSYALYVVVKESPLTLQHVDVGDGWQIPAAHIRGLTRADVLAQIKWDRKLKNLFAEKNNA